MAESPENESSSDPFGPPDEPCLCWCLHCHREFMSDQMWYQKHVKHGQEVMGFWMCPTNNCGGAGFTLDIFPADPDHPANAGWHSDDESDESFGDDESWTDPDLFAADKPYDPSEPEYAGLDAEEDVEGEEWKRGGEAAPIFGDPSMPEWLRAEQEQFDQPDRRPRIVDRSNEPDPPPMMPGDDSDIPF